ncbi:LCP family protein [Streptomyces sp. ISL-96]|uniref:LCP family protein n=1 Tax=Streptomyces sp. ISL-96 TaxID=2819191 RepID=UPI001BEAB0BD|nr:LCP family protein [Streptomyces sp. ISL-96]MBT2493315.1 LCP family protein [Streptomyces sp. ISL-96]
MDAQNRGRAEEIDPADQWVLNPDTGHYELRLDHSAGRSPAAAPPRRTSSRTNTRERAAGPRREVPVQRSRRASNGSRSAGISRDSGSGDGGAPQAGRRKRKAKKSGKKKALLWTGGVMGFVLVGVSVGAYVVYDRLNGNIDSVDVGDAANGASTDGPMNILIIGTDKRTGAGNEGYGDRKNSTGHADTTFLFHVSADRTNATALSIPRDLKTDIPDCPTKHADGTETVIPGTPYTRFNESFGVGGRDPGCTMRTVKQITGLPINHFMMADFNAVKTLTTAIGGVDVCLTEPIKDTKYSQLNLSAGDHRIQGEEALAFVRNRHGLGNESDLDRIKMQQQFIASMIRKMKEDTLGNPKRMLDLADAATKALTVNKEIEDLPKLKALAEELGRINIKNIAFTTIPVRDNPAETVKATVVLDPVKAPQVFNALQNDVSFTDVKKREKAAKSKQAALLKGPRSEASEVRVDVYNGSDTAGAAQATLNWLQLEQGVLKSTNKSNAPEKIAKTRLEYAPNQADQARKLADLMGLPAAALKKGSADAGEMEPMVLTLGADFKGEGVPISGPVKPPEVEKVQADQKICAK